MTVVVFIIVLAVLIFVHELGHFLVARACGIRVDAFALGFGPKLFSKKVGETVYSLNLVPFGGYVKIFGENPDEASIGGPDSGRSFVNKPKIQQIMVLVAGVFFNFLFAWFLYVCSFSAGVTATTSGFEGYAERFRNERIMVTYVAKDSPAEKAGIVPGDVIAVVGDGVSDLSVEKVQGTINASNGSPLSMAIDPKGGKSDQKNITVVPVKGLVEGRYAIGISMDMVGDLRLPFFSSVWEGFKYTGMMIKDTAVGLGSFISRIFTGTANFADVAGPVGIAGIVGDAAELGFVYLLMITAVISINLGVINLVPFPALDGGRILFVIIESAIRRPIPYKYANILNLVGFVLLIGLMVAVTYQDIARLVG